MQTYEIAYWKCCRPRIFNLPVHTPQPRIAEDGGRVKTAVWTGVAAVGALAESAAMKMIIK